MLYVKSCFYDLDTGKLEMEDVDGIHYSIDVYAVEDLCADTMHERSALYFLLYNNPVEYVNLLLSGKLRDYIQQNPIYLED